MKNRLALTHHKPGSLKELLFFAMPLMVIALSDNIIIALDRIILSHYSLAALNSVTLSSQFITVLQYIIWAVTGMTELFIAKLSSFNQKKEMATPCWQMIYLSLSTIPLIFLLAQYTGSFLLKDNYRTLGMPYYQIMIYSVPLIGIITTLSGFFVGQGKMKAIFYLSIFSNLINVCLDFTLIFGVKNIIPAMGPKGAAISGIISLSIQALWLFAIFVNKTHRTQYNTIAFGFNIQYFLKSLRLGLPIAFGHTSDMLGWLVLMLILSNTSTEIFTLISVGSTLYLIFAFFVDGLYRALSTIVSNHIASKRPQAIFNAIGSSIKLLAVALIIIAIPLIFFPNALLQLFNLKHNAASWHSILTLNFVFIWLFLGLNGLLWIFCAALTAYHDTKFLMVINISTLWLITIMPIYLLAKHASPNLQYIWPIINAYVVVASAAVMIRYYQMYTKNKKAQAQT